jgi:SAM-dependent methyltransferase
MSEESLVDELVGESHSNDTNLALEEIREFWDADAATYNNSRGHSPVSASVMAAWTAALSELLPAPPVKVLDVGAGTGFLSMIAARLGHQVTALDLSPKMLEQLERSAADRGLQIDVVVGPANDPPAGFDVVMERHVLWTLPDPSSALKAWRRSAPQGRLLLVESLWGSTDQVQMMLNRGRKALKSLRGDPPDHHGSYSERLQESLPLGRGTPPSRLAEMVAQQGWGTVRLERLRDVEWAEECELPLLERILGVSPRFVVIGE